MGHLVKKCRGDIEFMLYIKVHLNKISSVESLSVFSAGCTLPTNSVRLFGCVASRCIVPQTITFFASVRMWFMF